MEACNHKMSRDEEIDLGVKAIENSIPSLYTYVNREWIRNIVSIVVDEIRK